MSFLLFSPCNLNFVGCHSFRFGGAELVGFGSSVCRLTVERQYSYECYHSDCEGFGHHCLRLPFLGIMVENFVRYK